MADESNDRLRDLVTHRLSVDSEVSLDETQRRASQSGQDFAAVTENGKVIGLCSLKQVHQRLGKRYGYALFAEKPARDFMAASALIFQVGTRLESILEKISERESEFFYDDSILTDAEGRLIGLIPTHVLIRAQQRLLKQQLEKTERQREQLNEARALSEQAARLKSEFLATMSHEIRTPMNGIIGVIELLGESGLNPDQQELVRTADASAYSLLRIINDILDFSKIEAGKLDIAQEAIDLNELLLSILRLFQESAQKKGIYLRGNFSRVPSMLRGDPVRVRQVVTNLVSNAIKFTHRGGVEIESRIVRIEERVCHLQIHVRDTGIGIAKGKEKDLFQAFVQLDGSTSRTYGGTGLGLSISHRLTRLMGGKLTCQSKEGQGSCFTLHIPFEREDVAAPTVPSARRMATPPPFDGEAESLQKPHVLIVDDMPLNREIAGRFVSRLGFSVEFAGDGLEALEMIRNKAFDLVLMDCQMPNLDGYETTRRIRAGACGTVNENIFISAMTADAMNGDRERCMAAGMNAYIAKPIRLADLDALVADYRHHCRRLNTQGRQLLFAAPVRRLAEDPLSA